jgi:hypothetical protein
MSSIDPLIILPLPFSSLLLLTLASSDTVDLSAEDDEDDGTYAGGSVLEGLELLLLLLSLPLLPRSLVVLSVVGDVVFYYEEELPVEELEVLSLEVELEVALLEESLEVLLLVVVLVV